MVIAEHLVKTFIKAEKKGRRKVKLQFRAVDDISLTARDGEMLGIIGPNGAGKTTLLRMLGTMMEPDSGAVRHFLPDATELPDTLAVRQRMGYLSNNTKLYERFTVREFLEMLGSFYAMSKEDVARRLAEVTEELELGEFLDSPCGKLSTGQTQRVNIARCLFADPQLYILDEPTLGLDIMSAAAVVDFIRREKSRGKTIIYSTHYLEEAEQLCDRVVLLSRGRVLAEDSPADLCQKTGAENLREAFLGLIRADEAAAETKDAALPETGVRKETGARKEAGL